MASRYSNETPKGLTLTPAGAGLFDKAEIAEVAGHGGAAQGERHG